jgi:prevent-host-death family protein
MSDPFGRLRGMIESYATATDFRAYLAQIVNCVAYRQDRCVITRHGEEFAALVSYEDLEFLRKHRPRKIGPPGVSVFSPQACWHDHFPESPLPQTEPPPPPKPGEEMIHLEDPFEMPLETVRELYLELRVRCGESDELDEWIARAGYCLTVFHVKVPPDEDDPPAISPPSLSAPHNSG